VICVGVGCGLLAALMMATWMGQEPPRPPLWFEGKPTRSTVSEFPK
jgi:hypothetical protein